MKNFGEKKRFIFGWRALWLMLAALLFTQFLCLIFPVLAGFELKQIIASTPYLMASTALGWVAVVAVFDYFICRPQTGKPLRFNMRGVNVGTFFLSLPLFFGMVLIADFVVNQIPKTGDFFGKAYHNFEQIFASLDNDFPAAFLGAAIMAPVLEEVVFRGIVLRGLLNKGLSPTLAIWLSSLLFGLIHANFWQFTGATLIGFALGLIYYQTKSLLLVISFHMLNNIASILLGKFFGDQSLAEFSHLSPYLFLAAGLILYGFGYYFFTDKFRIIHQDSE